MRHLLYGLGLSLASLGLTFSGCTSMGGVLQEAGELIEEGGAEVLREPMRPVRGTTRVLVLALDGVSDEVLRASLQAGDLPALEALMGGRSGAGDVWPNAYAAPGVLSVLPSETAAGWAAVFTGAPPAESGVAGNEWFDRDSLRVSAPVPLSVPTIEETIEIYSDNRLGEIIQTPTVFEQAGVRSHVSMGFVHRGADLLNPPDLSDLGDLIGALVQSVFGGGRKDLYEALDHDTWEGVERGDDHWGLPDLQVAYFPGVDLVTHAGGAEAQREYLREEIAPLLRLILRRYTGHGILRDTYVLVVSDHGHTPLLADDAHSLGGDSDPDEPAEVFERIGVRLRPFEVGVDSSDYQAVMTYNEAFGFVYLADRSTCAQPGEVCDWSRAPRLDEDVLPVAEAFYQASQRGEHVPELEGTLDLVLVRASSEASAPFRVYDGGDLVPLGTYLEREGRTDLLEMERRMGWLTDGPHGRRAGDVVLLAKSGSARPIEERHYFGPPKVSGHGSPGRSDSLIPLVLARPGYTGDALQATLRAAVGERPTQLDISALILALLAED